VVERSPASRLYQQVAEQLISSIRAGDYGPGDRLPAERELAQRFSVSRPTVREAVIALELDGLVEVRVGSGVYVMADAPLLAARRDGRRPSSAVPMDVGPFELTEARMMVEGEVAALAASLITDAQIAELEALLAEMAVANREGGGEAVDQRFHLAIAEATRNSAMVAVVEQLWSIRERSPQCAAMFARSRASGNKPVVDEHRAIVDALAARDPRAARAAMRAHLSRVLGYLLDASETEAIEEAKARLAAQRDRFSAGLRS
jgi:GntR family transcriptional repressor for pyruvate dehydrogenase complex